MTTFFRPHFAAVLIAASATAIVGGMAGSANAAADGIHRLIAVSQAKADNANAAALQQAAAQRELLNRQQQARTGVRRLQSLAVSPNVAPPNVASRYNQTQTLQNSVQKKLDSTLESTIGKL